jgi:hypothetical protein
LVLVSSLLADFKIAAITSYRLRFFILYDSIKTTFHLI